MSLQKKALLNVERLLNTVSSYNVYVEISKACKDAGVTPEQEKLILDAYNLAEHSLVSVPIKDAKDWLTSIINEIP